MTLNHPKLTLYSSSVCPYAQRAVIALKLAGVEAEIVEIDLSVPREEWYLKINPYGAVPALKIGDDDFYILESQIVAQYILSLNPDIEIISKDPKVRAQSEFLIQQYGNRVSPAHYKFTYKQAQKEDAAVSPSPKELAQAEFEKQLQVFSDYLSKADQFYGPGPYAHGGKFTFVDLCLGTILTRLFVTEVHNPGYKLPTVETHPQLRRFVEWKDALLAHPIIQETTADSEGIVKNSRKFLH
ncbi:hypothetical protein BGZ73_007376 [Actinomortierella ambigua]|nr:hypothetical protein BGZ73_007376 [Actinomortierella ambigua]